jgi:hypothetical protein
VPQDRFVAGCVRLRTPSNSAREFELTFPRHALERLIRVLDAVLVIGAVRGKQPYDLIGTVGGHVANRTRREVDGLADLILVFLQRSSPNLERHGFALSSGASPDRSQYSSEIISLPQKFRYLMGLGFIRTVL